MPPIETDLSLWFRIAVLKRKFAHLEQRLVDIMTELQAATHVALKDVILLRDLRAVYNEMNDVQRCIWMYTIILGDYADDEDPTNSMQ